jgi:hypothetical protein
MMMMMTMDHVIAGHTGCGVHVNKRIISDHSAQGRPEPLQTPPSLF